MDNATELNKKEQLDKLLLEIEIVLGYTCSVSFLAFIFLASYLQMPETLRIALILIGSTIFAVGISYALKVEQIAGYYECKHCHNKYVPSYKSILFAMHIARTRRLKCPRCGRKSWSKKVLTK
jgi:DNA-directed RNA polymerase subunit RPC12/RpoP